MSNSLSQRRTKDSLEICHESIARNLPLYRDAFVGRTEVEWMEVGWTEVGRTEDSQVGAKA
jgi:hypothetical protein